MDPGFDRQRLQQLPNKAHHSPSFTTREQMESKVSPARIRKGGFIERTEEVFQSVQRNRVANNCLAVLPNTLHVIPSRIGTWDYDRVFVYL